MTEAKRRLPELVRRAEEGEEIILTRRGRVVVHIVPVEPTPDRQGHRALLEAVRAAAATKAGTGPNAARSQDFLFGDNGLPQ